MAGESQVERQEVMMEGGSLKAEAAKVANPPKPPLRRDPTFPAPPSLEIR